jgi:hypothetical protein
MRVGKLAKHKIYDLEHKLHYTSLKWRKKSFSNFNEEQILEKYISQLNIANKSQTVVDIGAGDGSRKSNSYALFSKGWNGVGIEYDSRKLCRLAKNYKHYNDVWACQCRVTPDNVVPLLQTYVFEKEFGILSIDIDSYDYYVLDHLLSDFRPQLIVTEINEKIPPPIKFAVKYHPNFQLTHHFFGYSIASLEDLLEKYDYALLELEYNNAFLAPREISPIKSMNIDVAYRQGYLERIDRKEKFKLNYDMEILHTLTPEGGMNFVNEFFSKHKGKYEISIN